MGDPVLLYYVSYIVSLIVDFGQMNARWRCRQAWRSWEDHSLGSRWVRLGIGRAGLACWERRLTLPFPAVLLHPKLQQTQRTLWQQHQRQNKSKTLSLLGFKHRKLKLSSPWESWWFKSVFSTLLAQKDGSVVALKQRCLVVTC